MANSTILRHTISSPKALDVRLANTVVMTLTGNNSCCFEVDDNYYMVFCDVTIHLSSQRSADLSLFKLLIGNEYLVPVALTMINTKTENSTTSYIPAHLGNDNWFVNPVDINSGNMNVSVNGVFLARK